VAFQLNKDQAIDLAKKIIGAAQNSQIIDVTWFQVEEHSNDYNTTS
jgi:hypothetical protein